MSAASARSTVSPWPPEPFVGRERELGELRAALDRAAAGAGCIQTISGEPGIGKSRLAEELAGHADSSGVRVLRGQAREAGGAPAYWPWLRAVRPLLESTTQKQLAADWGAGADVAAMLLPELGSRLPGVKPYHSPIDSSETTRFRMLDTLAAYLERVSRRQPLLVILDDLQWADRDSLDLLLYLARRVTRSPALILGVHRRSGLDADHPLLRALGELVKEPRFREHRLEGLSEVDVLSYLRSLRGRAVPGALARRLREFTAGNPLYVTQLVKGSAGAEPSLEVLPEGVRGAIANRLLPLSRHTREALEAACLFSGELAIAQLAAVLGEPAEAVLGALDEAARAGIVRAASGRSDHYDFVHELMREAIRAEIPLPRRERLHARIGGVLEAFYGEDAPAHAAMIAAHLAAARSVVDGEKLARCCLAAARHALELQTREEAIRHVEIGLEAVEGRPMDDLRAELLLVRSIALEPGYGHQGEVVEAVETALEQFERSGNARCALELAGRVGHVLVPRLGAAFLDRVLRFTEPGSSEAGRALVALATGLGCACSDYQGARGALEQALRIAADRRDRALELHALQADAEVEYVNLEYGRYAEAAASMVGAAVALSDPRAECAARLELCRALAFVERRAEAHPHVQRALAIAEALGERQTILSALNQAAWLAMYDGNADVARRSIGRIVEESPLGPLVSFDPGYLHLIIAYESGHVDEGRELLARALDRMQGVVPGWNLPTFFATLAILEGALATGDLSRLALARRWTEAVRLSPDRGPRGEQHVWSCLAQIAWLGGDTGLAAALHEELHDKRLGLDVGWLQVSYGVLCRMLGRMDEAVERLRAARDVAGWAVVRIVRTTHVLAETLAMRDAPGDRDEAGRLWKDALEMARRHELVVLERQMQSGLEALARASAPARNPQGLTDRELEVLRLLAAGKTNKEIGWELHISERTVENHVTRVFAKTHVTNRTEAATFAQRSGLA